MAGAKVTSLVPKVVPVYKRIASLFPQKHVVFGFAYGSGVFAQGGIKLEKKPMVDMILVVDNSEEFHKENLSVNPTHYSFLKHFGPRALSFVQTKLPSKVYFNTLIPFDEETIYKYGVVNSVDLFNDLLDWNYLYLSGRLHKPVKFIGKPTERLTTALRINLLNALHAALVILPHSFDERDLYTVIATFSYNGDFRMVFGEDRNKVSNIVDRQIPAFRKIYDPVLKMLDVEITNKEDHIRILKHNTSSTTRLHHLYQLPKTPLKALVHAWRNIAGGQRKDHEEVIKNLSHHPEVGQILEDTLRSIVFKSSITQSLKGLFTAGFKKSFVYSNTKIQKMLKANEEKENV